MFIDNKYADKITVDKMPQMTADEKYVGEMTLDEMSVG
jgi:hypothetical protein